MIKTKMDTNDPFLSLELNVINEFKPSNAIRFDLTKETAGLYKCRSHNSIGSIEKIIKVTYFGK